MKLNKTLSVILMLLASFPLFLSYINPHEGHVPTGISSYGAGDLPVYFSYINQIKEGNILLKDLHTLEREKYGTLNILWLVPGLTARYFNLSPGAAFHITRIIFIPFLVVACGLLISLFLKDKREKLLAALLLFFGSGLGGWFAQLFKGAIWSRDGRLNFPMDLSVPELSVFGSVLLSPHLAASWAFFALTAYLLIRAFREQSIRLGACAGLAGLIFFNFHPYYAPFFAAFTLFLAILFGLENKNFKRQAIILSVYLMLSAPSLIYHFWLIVSDPVIWARAEQNRTFSPPFYTTLISFGLFIPFSIISVKNWQRARLAKLLILWIVLQFAFLYIGTNFQRRFTEGLMAPMAILTSAFLYKFWTAHAEKLNKLFFPSAKRILAGLLLFLGFGLSNYIIFSNRLKEATELKPPVYLDNNFVLALEKIKIAPGNQVLAPISLGNHIPYFSGKRVYAGHWAETIYYEQKELAVKKFFGQEAGRSFRKNILENNNIDIVLTGPKEKNFEHNWPDHTGILDKIYENKDYTIYLRK